MSVPVGRSFRCQVCRELGSKWAYGVDKKLKQPPRATFTCTNEKCGGLAMCSAECYNVWHFHPEVLSSS